MSNKPELLVPAGDDAALDAALERGADAIYFGLLTLNARRGAANFHHGRLGEIVGKIHGVGARAFLTLNITLTTRETGQAARALELARQAGVDGVLVADPAFLPLVEHYPEVEFHFSTQAAISNSAAVEAARELGIRRVVLARELSLAEIKACSAIDGIETEVFCQGALCFSISGRCLLSSWVGGRSGNRGACASPCRVPWAVDNGRSARLLSMHDLSLLERLPEIASAGVSCLKIEGRLKKADWVGHATDLYRRALDGESAESLAPAAEILGNYSGRKLTSAYLDSERSGMVGEAGRMSGDISGSDSEADPGSDDNNPPTYDLVIDTSGKKIACRLDSGGYTEEWELPRTRVHRPERALTLGDIGEWLEQVTMQDKHLGLCSIDEPGMLVPRKTANKLADAISAALHRAAKGPDTTIRTDLPEPVRAIASVTGKPHAANTHSLGERPNRVRLARGQVDGFWRNVKPESVIVEQARPGDIKRLAADIGKALVVALPTVFYEAEIPAVREMLKLCAAKNIAVEVNDWGGWWLAREAGIAELEAGPGMAVLNPVAAGFLGRQGCGNVSVTIEADRKQLEEFSKRCPLPYSLTIFSRPPLMMTRVDISGVAAEGSTLEDSRNTRIIPRREGAVTVLRPEDPMNISDLGNSRIRARWLVADLIDSPEPVLEWYSQGEDAASSKPYRFNYDHSLY